jgi:hypothetical protein
MTIVRMRGMSKIQKDRNRQKSRRKCLGLARAAVAGCLAAGCLAPATWASAAQASAPEQATAAVQEQHAGPAAKALSRSEQGPENSFQGKRDPFDIPGPAAQPERRDREITGPLPPGNRGLIISELRLEGVVRQDADHRMIAVVTNRTNRAYFLEVHDQVYDGEVTAITPGSIRFRENTLDRDGRVISREVIEKLGSPPGEEQ